jgi:hypothetical protein
MKRQLKLTPTAHRGGHIIEDRGGISFTVLFENDFKLPYPCGPGATDRIPCIIV